jgi:hypothetical protein
MKIDASAVDRIKTLGVNLTSRPYDRSAEEFVRFRVDSNDDALSGVLRAVIAEGEQGCEAFRREIELEEGASEGLCLFAMRRTLQGRRQSSLGLLYEALDAWALVANIADVSWDAWLKANLFVARSLGGDAAAISRRFSDLAHEDASRRFDVALEAMNRVASLSSCHIAEVTTSHGVGFIEMLVFRDATKIGFRGAPKLGDNEVEFQPRSNLAQLSVTLADALDVSKCIVTSAIRQDQLAATCFSLSVSGSYVASTGCLSFIGEGVAGEPSYTVLVAELPEGTEVDALADAAINTDDQAAVYDGSRLILFSPLPSFDNEDDARPDFRDVENLALDALSQTATK